MVVRDGAAPLLTTNGLRLRHKGRDDSPSHSPFALNLSKVLVLGTHSSVCLLSCNAHFCDDAEAMTQSFPFSRFRNGILLLALIAAPALARDSLGMFGTWGAFRDPAVPRCYAIAMAAPSARPRNYQPYAAVGTWPTRGVRGQFHVRLSRAIAPGSVPVLSLGSERFRLSGGGGDAWAADKRMDAAVIAAMRSATTMTVSARDTAGRGFANTYPLAGAATAMDAAAVACAPHG